MSLLSRIMLFAGFCFIVSLAPAKAQVVDATESNYALGAMAYKDGAFRRAFDAWSLGAYEGNADSQYNLGVLYLEGRGVERNAEQARNWFLKAAEKNHREAQYNLGHMALSGMGTDKSTAQALKWWKLAALGGYASAQFNYGRALYLGVEGNKDEREGMVFIRLAAAQKDKRALEFINRNVADETESSIAESKVPEQNLPKVKGSASVAGSTSRDVVSAQPEGVKLNIVRDERPLAADYLARSRDTELAVFAQADLNREVALLAPATLVNVIQIESNSLQIRSASNPPVTGWVAARSLNYSGESSTQLRAAWNEQLSLEEKPLDDVKRKPLSAVAALAAPNTNEESGISPKREMGNESVLKNENIWLFTQQSGARAILLFTVLNSAKALEIAQQPAYRERAHLFTTVSKQKQWTFLLLGPYADARSAKVAMKKLPANYRDNARIREISVIAKNRCAKRTRLSAEQAKGLDAYCLD